MYTLLIQTSTGRENQKRKELKNRCTIVHINKKYKFDYFNCLQIELPLCIMIWCEIMNSY
jgi:hypothetical protein